MFIDVEMCLVERYGELKENPGTHPRQHLSAYNRDMTFMKLRVSATAMTKRNGDWNAELL
jgi:hypothetical protein